MASFELRFGVSRIIGGRKYQEDEYTCYDGLSKQKGPALFAVFDGHGTDDYSACASDTLHKQILESDLFKAGKYREAILAGFAAEDKLLLEQVKAKRGGSTSTVAIIVEDNLYIGHLGDSRAVLGVQDKPLTHHSASHHLPVRAVRISRDHRPDDPDERKRIIEAGGVVAQGRIIGKDSAINMSRALGDFDFKIPQNRARGDFISSAPYVPEPIKLNRQCKFVVLGSDGLWDQMEERTVVYLIDNLWYEGLSPDEIAGIPLPPSHPLSVSLPFSLPLLSPYYPFHLPPLPLFLFSLPLDGLWNQMEELTVVYLIDNLWYESLSPDEIADTITGRLTGSCHDNVTIIIVFFIWDKDDITDEQESPADVEVISEHQSTYAQS